MRSQEEIPFSISSRFPDHDPADLLGHSGFLIGRLLEQGDSRELAWLFETVGRPQVTTWFVHHGGRVLTQRSRALWEKVLGPSRPASVLAESLWPLA